ncbi:MAG: molybdenum cofactor biosynthesis protein MoaE [Flavobacteriales bacterium]|nr:molybdenum cofactor biosynthesis protein MoaE [Flavobacteriales bacterium]
MEKSTHRIRDIFVEGAIAPGFIAESISKHATRLDIGAHEIFLGQIRADVSADAGSNKVTAIEYTAYKDMALERMITIREEAFKQWPAVTCLHVHHSLGMIPAGQLCFMVFASAAHRQQAREAVAFVVDAVKKDLPIFGRELFDDDTHKWKMNRE